MDWNEVELVQMVEPCAMVPAVRGNLFDHQVGHRGRQQTLLYGSSRVVVSTTCFPSGCVRSKYACRCHRDNYSSSGWWFRWVISLVWRVRWPHSSPLTLWLVYTDSRVSPLTLSDTGIFTGMCCIPPRTLLYRMTICAETFSQYFSQEFVVSLPFWTDWPDVQTGSS